MNRACGRGPRTCASACAASSSPFSGVSRQLASINLGTAGRAWGAKNLRRASPRKLSRSPSTNITRERDECREEAAAEQRLEQTIRHVEPGIASLVVDCPHLYAIFDRAREPPGALRIRFFGENDDLVAGARERLRHVEVYAFSDA